MISQKKKNPKKNYMYKLILYIRKINLMYNWQFFEFSMANKNPAFFIFQINPNIDEKNKNNRKRNPKLIKDSTIQKKKKN